MKKVLLILLLLLLTSSFVSAESIKIGGEKVVYDEIIEGDSDFDGVNDRTSYYLDDELVFSAYDTDGDGEQDMWFTYTENSVMETAMRDTTGDGRPENIVSYNEEGEIVSETEKGKIPWPIILIGAIIICGVLIYFLLGKKKIAKKKRKPISHEVPKKEQKARKKKETGKKIKAKAKDIHLQAKHHAKKGARSVQKSSKKAAKTVAKHAKKGVADAKYFYDTKGKQMIKEIPVESKKAIHHVIEESKQLHKQAKKKIQKKK